jgi:crotonobetainyl-CoA:carnitine CoA-transferase CaiB-like acyl-CoA transferase
MVETALNVGAEPVLEYSAHGAELCRTGNRGPAAAPQGLFAARGPEEWLAVAVATDAQWAALCQVLGDPGWAADPGLATAAGRRAAHDAIDEHLAAWAGERDAAAAAAELSAAGVPAERVVPPSDVLDNPQLAARGFAETLHHPVLGRYPLPGMPVRLASRRGPWFDRPAPTLGQHNDEVLGVLPGVGPDRLAELRDLGVIGERPAGL